MWAEHPDTLSSMDNLAFIYGNQGLWGKAEQLRVQVPETGEGVVSAKHPNTLKSMNNLAATYIWQGK